MKKILKYSSYILVGLSLIMSGCVKVSGHKVRQAEGERVGRIVVYTVNNSKAETAGVFIDNQFIAALPEKHRLSHQLCRGNYLLKARSIMPQDGKKNKILQVSGQTHLHIVEGKTQYLMLSRKDKGWEFIVTDKAPEGLKSNDDKLVRRVTDAMLECK